MPEDGQWVLGQNAVPIITSRIIQMKIRLQINQKSILKNTKQIELSSDIF